MKRSLVHLARAADRSGSRSFPPSYAETSWRSCIRSVSSTACGGAGGADPVKKPAVRVGPPPPIRQKPWSAKSQHAFTFAAIAAGAVSGTIMYNHVNESNADAPHSLKKLRTIRRKEVEAHKTAADRIWVTRGEGVYDITDFVSSHPGGAARIMLAAGGDISVFWGMYAQHKQEQVYEILESMRIGTLPLEDQIDDSSSDPYSNDPKRHADMCERSAAPYNAEAPIAALDSHITTNEFHFKRHHLPVPDVVPQAYELQVSTPDGIDPICFTLEELKTKFPSHSVTVTLQCAGNRRAEMAAEREVHGLGWTGGAISTAVWTGVKLSDVLKSQNVAAGPQAKHVEFVGLDCDLEGQRYAASIPIEKALADDGDVLLAYEMNGEPIPRDHGFPLRAIVPGTVAARCVKWVEKIIVSDDESDCHWQQHDYKGFCPDQDWNNVDWSSAPSIQETPVTSAILSPGSDSTIITGAASIPIRGYAFAGGGRAIVRVDVSIDGGKTWKSSKLKGLPDGQEPGYHRAWAWRHWEIEFPLEEPAKTGDKFLLICKAVDDSYNVQPDSFKPIYNARGVLANAWHRVEVTSL